jgi:hypothetical protein
MIPTMVLPSKNAHLSAAILDLFASQKRSWIEKYHGIQSSKQYKYFYNVNHTLKVIVDALKCRLPPDSDWTDPKFRLMCVFESTSTAFNKKFRHCFRQ